MDAAHAHAHQCTQAMRVSPPAVSARSRGSALAACPHGQPEHRAHALIFPLRQGGGRHGEFRRGFLPYHGGGGGKDAQAPYTVTRRHAPGPTAVATCITVLSPVTSAHACPAHKLLACITCKQLRLSAATCCAKGHPAPGYVDRRTLSKVCQAHGLPLCPHCTLMQRGVQHCCQQGHHKVNTPQIYLGKRTAPAQQALVNGPGCSLQPLHTRGCIRTHRTYPLHRQPPSDGDPNPRSPPPLQPHGRRGCSWMMTTQRW